jgi:hypothetical protein
MDGRYPSWVDKERELIHQYGCKSHAPGTCPGSPRYRDSFDGVLGDPRYCTPALPEWPSPLYFATRSPELEYGASSTIPVAEVMLGHGQMPTVPYSPLEPHTEEIEALAARGCNFGSAPWLGPLNSPHYGPPGSCINHSYGTCPSVNPYTRFMDQRAALGLPTSWQQDDRNRYRPSSPTTLAPVARSSMMKKRKTKSKKPKKLARMQRVAAQSPPTRMFDMTSMAAALTAETPGPADPLTDLMSQLRVSRRENRSRRATRTKGLPKKKKKGGRRTRK